MLKLLNNHTIRRKLTSRRPCFTALNNYTWSLKMIRRELYALMIWRKQILVTCPDIPKAGSVYWSRFSSKEEFFGLQEILRILEPSNWQIYSFTLAFSRQYETISMEWNGMKEICICYVNVFYAPRLDRSLIRLANVPYRVSIYRLQGEQMSFKGWTYIAYGVSKCRS